MATLTGTELGTTGNYIDLGSPATLDNLGSMSILVYCKPTGAGGGNFGYLVGKTLTSSTSGLRFFIDHNSGNPNLTLGLHSTTANAPAKIGANNSVVYNQWQHLAATWTGVVSPASSEIQLYAGAGVPLAAITAASSTNGSGSVNDAANSMFLLNRAGLGREFVGSCAYIAIWNRVLSLAELQTAQNTGPLDVPSGLVLLWANQADLSAAPHTPSSRSTYAAGEFPPPNTDLGDGVTSNTLTAEVGTIAISGQDVDFTYSAAPAMTISGDFPRSSINESLSSVVGNTVTIRPGVQLSNDVFSGQSRWIEFSAELDNALGETPDFVATGYASSPANGTYHGAPMQSARRFMFAPPIIPGTARRTFTYFDNKTVNTSSISFNHNTPFAINKLNITRGRQISLEEVGYWYENMATLHAGKFVPGVTAATFSPTIGGSWPAADFIADEYTSQTNERGIVSGVLPLYEAVYDDTSVQPDNGGEKVDAVVFAGVHAGEDAGVWNAEVGLEWVMSSSDAHAVYLRKHVRFQIVLMVNAPGFDLGGARGSYTLGTGSVDDANRHASDVGGAGLEIVTKPNAIVDAFLASGSGIFAFFLDSHGTYVNTDAVFVDAADVQTSRFQSRYNTATGRSMADEGNSHAGFFAIRMKNVKACYAAITTEHGDPAPVTDSTLQTIAEGEFEAFSAMMQAGEIPEPATAYSLTAEVGTIAINGQNVEFDYNPSVNYTLTAEVGEIGITGYPVDFVYNQLTQPVFPMSFRKFSVGPAMR